VVHGDIGRTAFEIAHGVATLDHQLTNQLVRLDDDPFGVIDEAALQSAPSLAEPSGLSRRQRCDREVLNALFARLEFRFGFCSPSELTDSSAVFRTEALLKPLGLLLPLGEKPCRNCKQCNDHNTDNDDNPL
jgi:hypothetical protein